MEIISLIYFFILAYGVYLSVIGGGTPEFKQRYGGKPTKIIVDGVITYLIWYAILKLIF